MLLLPTIPSLSLVASVATDRCLDTLLATDTFKALERVTVITLSPHSILQSEEFKRRR
jgi:hypothetical protein